jgi:membrane protease YdiL (CAAX protease family)
VLRARWGLAATIGLTSAVFGLLHLNNPGATPTSIANVMAAGVFLAGVRVVTGSLAAAWAAHFAWNWTLAAGFHTAVSGLPFGTPGYRLVDTGSDWLSGGAWGPEGSVLVAVGMMGAFAGLSWAMGRGRRDGMMAAAPDSTSLDAGGQTGRQEHSA